MFCFRSLVWLGSPTSVFVLSWSRGAEVVWSAVVRAASVTYSDSARYGPDAVSQNTKRQRRRNNCRCFVAVHLSLLVFCALTSPNPRSASSSIYWVSGTLCRKTSATRLRRGFNCPGSKPMAFFTAWRIVFLGDIIREILFICDGVLLFRSTATLTNLRSSCTVAS